MNDEAYLCYLKDNNIFGGDQGSVSIANKELKALITWLHIVISYLIMTILELDWQIGIEKSHGG